LKTFLLSGPFEEIDVFLFFKIFLFFPVEKSAQKKYKKHKRLKQKKGSFLKAKKSFLKFYIF
jgi:hypothetical protein